MCIDGNFLVGPLNETERRFNVYECNLRKDGMKNLLEEGFCCRNRHIVSVELESEEFSMGCEE